MKPDANYTLHYILGAKKIVFGQSQIHKYIGMILVLN